MSAHENEPEETPSGAWQALPIAWIVSESFAPRLTRGQVGARLLIWTGNDTQWVSPLVSAQDGVSWTGSLNFTADSN
jgi:hypothetical protein